MAWTYPHTFHDGTGEVASGVQVMDNFEKARAQIEAVEGVGMVWSEGVWNNGEVKEPSATKPALCWYEAFAPVSSYRIALSVSGGPTIEIQGEKGNPATLGPILVPPGGKIKSDGAAVSSKYIQAII